MSQQRWRLRLWLRPWKLRFKQYVFWKSTSRFFQGLLTFVYQHFGNRILVGKIAVLSVVIGGILLLGAPQTARADSEIRSLTPERFQALEQLADRAVEAARNGQFAEAEEALSEAIEALPSNPALWSNRGNVRASQNKLDAALSDYDRAIEIAPDLPDAYLNRGTVYEALGRWDDAIADYNRILDIAPEEAAAYNNRGNAKAGLGRWQEALADYAKARELTPNFALARANYALALYQTEQTAPAVSEMRKLVRRYPQFADMRAALTAVLWATGKRGEAESNWVATYGLDRRYGDLEWVANVRRWPPRMVEALENFLNLRA
jgi:tetratricopeptide (TPR) repeat protein